MASRQELFAAAGLIPDGPDLDAITEQSYLLQEEKERKGMLAKQPGGRAFYASMFPGGEDEKRCPRYALYSMMNVPNPDPIKPTGRAVIEMGKAAEKQIVWRWGKMGLLLGVKTPEKEYSYLPQLGFDDKELWLSGYADAVMDIRPRWDYVLPVDVKSKSTAKIDAMRAGDLPPYEEDHYKQVQAYLYLCRKFHVSMGWEAMGLLPAKLGSIFYVSRDNPRHTWVAHVPYNEEFVNAGIERLKEWREYFLNDELPERPPEWKWTKPPCQYCPLKKQCKADIKADVTRLSDSHAVVLAKKLIPNYDEQKVREAVMKRWTQTPMP
jgi:CRISPR/Cas system-associated exonuclease Cas4 (RecB family)